MRLAYHFMIRSFQDSVVILHGKCACYVIVSPTHLLPVLKSDQMCAEEYCADFRIQFFILWKMEMC